MPSKKGWICEECGHQNPNLKYTCQKCGFEEPKRKEQFMKMIQTLDIVANASPLPYFNLFSSVLGSTASISEIVEKQDTGYDNIKKKLENLEDICKKKAESLREKEEKVEKLERIVSDMSKTLSNLQNENKTLALINETLKDIVEKLSKRDFAVQIVSSAEAKQEQTQSQFQSQTLTIALHQEIVSQALEVKKEMETNPEAYRILPDYIRKELSGIIEEIENTDKEGLLDKLKDRMRDSKLAKYISKPENVVKISSTLLTFLSTLQKLGIGE